MNRNLDSEHVPRNDFNRTAGRVSRIIVVIGLVGTGLAGLWGGWRDAAGFLMGAAGGYLNFRSLSKVVAALGTPASSGRVGAFAWLLFRLILLAIGAFVIIRFTQIHILAVFAGLCVPLAAVIAETIFPHTYAR